MSLIIDGIDRDTFIFNKNVYKVAHPWFNMTGANAQNAKYRGNDLGAFTENYATNIQNGVFDSMQVGDTFTQNGHTYKIGGFNYLGGADHNPNLGNHLLMITDNLTNREMNPDNTTTGGFVGSEMWKSYFPTVVEQLKADFGDHLLTWNEFLTTGTDAGVADQGDYFAVQASMMNSAMYSGSPNQFSTPSRGKNWNTGIEAKQLPIMNLHPDEQKNGGRDTWQRDVCSSSDFTIASDDGSPDADYSSTPHNVRAFFLIG